MGYRILFQPRNINNCVIDKDNLVGSEQGYRNNIAALVDSSLPTPSCCSFEDYGAGPKEGSWLRIKKRSCFVCCNQVNRLIAAMVATRPWASFRRLALHDSKPQPPNY